MHLRDKLAEKLGCPVSRLVDLHGGMIAEVRLVELSDGRRFVVKTSERTPLSVEARMLEFLSSQAALPVPAVVEHSNDLLIMEFVEGESGSRAQEERNAAEHLARLHSLQPGEHPPFGVAPSVDSFGFYFDTLIGPFPQRNRWDSDWPAFYGSQRLEPLLEICLSRGHIGPPLAGRLEAVVEGLPSLLDHSPRPGLIHGDVWSGNVLFRGDVVSAFLDPAIYFADPEVELAFIELFSTFGRGFWQRYEELRGVDQDYRRLPRDLYQLYPLLVHVALFGAGYVRRVEERLDRLGF